ncbi:DNA-directed RNA polymerase, mitochondrial [Contarinia nasturtii]|uniref:DNA-directed RNA polymerase, mitochondrial n=1 Tax=Contarinia nasturtii TaxID=265458 RepID=UPI0012D443EC|nr:DNA-directed RNA polymerase, mitochondrial [Contarinia nasturtii]
MERVMYINSLVSNKNRLLFRLPIYQYVIGERNFSALRNCSSASRRNLLFNNIICRQKSSTLDENIQKNTKPITQRRIKIIRTEQTNVTQLTDATFNNQIKRPLKLMSRVNLPRFVNDTANSNQNENSQMLSLNEEPVIYIPESFKTKLQNNTELIHKFMDSFEKFVKAVPPPEERIKKSKLPVNQEDSDLQKQFDSFDHEKHLHASLTQNLRCYINACISENLTDRAFAVLKSIRASNHIEKREYTLKDSILYIDLMAKYAEMVKWSSVDEIYNILVADKLPITPQAYMNIFDCLGRMQESDKNLTLIKQFEKKAEQQGISLNDIMDKSTFIKNQRTFVLQAMRRIHPSFVPVYSPPQLVYSNKLLDSLNEGIQSIEVPPTEMLKTENSHTIARPRSGFSADELNEYTEEQIKNEKQGYITVKNITMLDSSKYSNENVITHREILEKLTNQWRADILHAIRRKMSISQHKVYRKSTKLLNIYPYMRLLTPDEYTDLLINELEALAAVSDAHSPTVLQLYTELGAKVMNRYHTKLREQNGINEKVRSLYKIYSEILCSGNCSDNPRQLWQRIIHHSRQSGPCIFQKDIVWPWGVKIDIGKWLFKILLDDIKIDANILKTKNTQTNYVPVLYSLFRNRNLQSYEEIQPHPVFAKLLTESKRDTMIFKTNEVPMLCPPIPWTSGENGGYLQSLTVLLRLPYNFTHQHNMVCQTPQEQLYPPLDACNQLGSIPWRVNTTILDLAIKVFNLGGNNKLDVPLTPDDMVTDEHLRYRGITWKQFENMKIENIDKYKKQQNELLSVYTDTLYKLSLANHFRDRAIWLPTNLDFRGRNYPVPPHLTHLSADLTRSMLCFYQKQPLGENGLDWLKLHCINLTGLKKRASVHDRLLYANEIIDDIIDSADNPLDGRQWWLNSDDPWQTLAACMEIGSAMRSPNPAEYMSGLPIHQDGSCNGLQHYAALGRDEYGAISVNLAPSNVPQDVYSTVANRVEELRQIDAENGVKVAIELEGLIKRKIVKQTVMTTVYGVTTFGATLQIKKQLKNIDFPSDQLKVASFYLMQKTFLSLSEMFKSAREIQDWLTDSARLISDKIRMQHVEWTTPLGLPIIQPYIKENKLTSKATIKSIINSKMVVNAIKEKNGFPPNFIHSLDACHMMLTALNCERAGVTFVSVHDCFWTHPSTVPIMNQICRQQFILLHSQPILEDLAEAFYQKYVVEFNEKQQKETNKTKNRGNKKKEG